MRRASTLTVIASLALLLAGSGPQETQDAERTLVGRYTSYAVAADHAAASRAGAEVLAAGGSAADGAAATMLALGVANPASSGLGGGGFALYWDESEKEIVYIDFREEAPSEATADMYDDVEPGEGPLAEASQLGGLASGVPGEPAGIDALLERFGKLDREQVAAPALRLAEEGARVAPYVAELSTHFAEQMKRDPTMRKWFEKDAGALRAGQTIRQPELARTLRAFARSGAEPFYEGRIARQIARTNRQQGGIMKREDLAAYEVVEREPMSAERFGHRWVTAPLPSAGGFTMLQSLALLERWEPHWRGGGQDAVFHALAESWKGAYLDRQRYAGDTDHVEVPMDELMAPERMDRRAEVFHPTLARPAADWDMPLPGDQGGEGEAANDNGTSHLCVVGPEGDVASITTTVNLPFGARYTAAGMVMNDEMDDFARGVGEDNAFGLPGGEPNLPGPGKRPVSTMSPTIVFDDEGRPVLCAGAAGGSRIVTATEQVAFRMVVLGQDAGEAIRAPRVHHQGLPKQIRTESEVPADEAVVDRLTARGHEHEPIDHVAVVQAIRIEHTDDGRRLVAVTDPRKAGEPAGE